jgi:hypothetical protein
MNVIIDWQKIDDDSQHLWDWCRCLYCYATDDNILYIGKAEGKSIRQRWTRSAKPDFWDFIEMELDIFEHDILVGHFWIEQNRRLTSSLIADVESLLISHVQPAGNIMCKKSRISRPGLLVTCGGDWPSKAREFYDGQ